VINANLNPKSLKKRFSVDDRLKIDNFLESEVAASVKAEIQEAPFELVYVIDDKIKTTSKQKMDAMSVDDKKRINQQIVSDAAKGKGFLYGSCHLGAGRPAEIGEKMVALFECLQSEETLSLIRTITGDQSIRSVSGHYTRYLPGHYLTRHRDVVESEQRRFAYVLSFTEDWHPDWGGLLQYYEEDGTPRDAWAPKFNTLTLFDVRHIHSVTYVTPFAQSPRLSLTGWFRAT
jgi:Rps23 Pro-64 3,4-dihydroxylase Tpa1-like proline 4-hydroxylase